jgi:hypothetical protein
MPWFDDVNVDELSDAPESVKNILKQAATEGKQQQVEFNALKDKVEALSAAPAPPANQPAPPQKDNATIAMELSLQTLADSILHRMSMNPKFKYFSVLETELRGNLAQSPLNLRANEGYVVNVYNMLVGQNMTEIREHETKKEGRFFTESGGPSLPTPPAAKTGVDSLSEAEKAYCNKNGINPETYAKSKEYHKPVMMGA